MACGVAFILGFVATVLLQHATAQKVHVVGDATGWTIPSGPAFYSDWAAKNKFAVGDSLTFNFPANAHNVLEVTKESFEECGSEDDAMDKVISTSPATVKLSTAGVHYYICTVGKHCLGGQKLSVTVGGGGDGAVPPSSKTPSSAAAPSDAHEEAKSPSSSPSESAQEPSSSSSLSPSSGGGESESAQEPSSSSSSSPSSGGESESAPAPSSSSSSAVMASIYVTFYAIVMSLF